MVALWKYLNIPHGNLGYCLYCLLGMLVSWRIDCQITGWIQQTLQCPVFSCNQTENPPWWLLLNLNWTKTTKEEGGTAVLTAHDDDLCTVAALNNHMLVNSKVPADAPLFAFEMPDGGWSMMLKHQFMDECRCIWNLAGLQLVDGHSYWIGGSVKLLLAGVPPEVVTILGGWTFLAFLLYWRQIQEILPMNISKAYKKKHIEELASDFEQFHIRNHIPSNISVDDT